MPTAGALPASMGKRLLAFVIDGVAALLLGGGFVVAGLLPLVSAAQDPTAELPGVPVLVPVGYALQLGLAVFQWWYLGTRGWTIGKRLVGLRVLDAQTGRPVGMGRGLVRYLVPAAGVLACGIGQWVVYLSPFFDSSGRRQGWHDKAARSVVLDVAVGVDPMTAPGRPDAQDAARRIDRLLRSQDAGTPGDWSAPADPAPAAPATAAPAPAAPPAAPPGLPAAPPPAPAPPATGTPSTTPPAAPSALVPPPPAPPPAPAPRVRVAPGVISSVPGAPADTHGEADDATGEIQVPPALRPAPTADAPASAEHRAHTEPPAPPGEQDGPSTGTPALADDVERTRLRPARGKVPEVPQDTSTVVLHLTDGRRIPVTGTALLGRNPSPREGEEVDQLIAIDDPGRSVSKTHLALGVERGGVWVRDRDSTNGTVVTLADGQQILCAAGQQIRLPEGASVALGDHGFTVHAAE